MKEGMEKDEILGKEREGGKTESQKDQEGGWERRDYTSRGRDGKKIEKVGR